MIEIENSVSVASKKADPSNINMRALLCKVTKNSET